jgi:hypothetical protein
MSRRWIVAQMRRSFLGGHNGRLVPQLGRLGSASARGCGPCQGAAPIGDMRKTDRQLVLGREHEVTSKFVMSWKPMRQRRLRQIKARTLRQHRSSLLGSVPKKNATAIGRPMRRRGVSAVDFIDHASDQEPSLPQPARCRPIFPESAKAEWSARPSWRRRKACWLFCPFELSHSKKPFGAHHWSCREADPPTSAWTILAPSTMARILPKAISRGRYFIPQSGAMMMSLAGT